MHKTLSRITFLLLLCILPFQNQAQKGPVAAGGDATGFGGTSSFSIGQIDYIVIDALGGSSYQGLQHPLEIYQLVAIDDAIADFEISAFPNPAYEDVILQIGTASVEGLSYTLTDMHGHLLRGERLYDSKTMISLSDVANATYILSVREGSAQIKSFKIIKR